MQFTTVRKTNEVHTFQTNDASSITALIDGELYTATDEHPFFVQIVEAVVDGTATDTFNGEAGV